MQLIINGQNRAFEQPVGTVARLIEQLAVPGARTAIELNGTVIERHLFDATALRDNDRIEIVSFVGGG